MTNSFGCGAGVLILALSRRRIALSFDTGPASVPVPGHGMADAGTSSVSCRARTWRKLPDMTRPGLRLPTGAPRRTQKDQRKAAGTRQPTQKPTTATRGSRQWGKNTNLAKARRIAGIARFLSATDSVSHLPQHDMIFGS